MCLHVESVPFSKRYGLVRKVYKKVEHVGHGRYQTPFQNCPVPYNGILHSSMNNSLTINTKQRSLTSEVVHSYKKHNIYLDLFEAYAIGVCASGGYQIGSIGLFIPKLCRLKKKNEIVAVLEDIALNKGSLYNNILKLNDLNIEILSKIAEFYHYQCHLYREVT